jgi:Family of unknown function (DUF6516)
VKKTFLDKYGLRAHNRKKIGSPEKASKILHQRVTLKSGLLSERIIWRISPSIKYPLAIKYRLILVNPITADMVLLYDNHWPKGPHIHGSNGERPYDFINIDKLRKDFVAESLREEKKYHENKKNSY